MKQYDYYVGLENIESESEDDMWNKKLYKDMIEGKLRTKWCNYHVRLENSESESEDKVTVQVYMKESNVRRY